MIAVTVRALQSALDAGDVLAAGRHAAELDRLMPGDTAARGALGAVKLAAGEYRQASEILSALPETVDRLLALALCAETDDQRAAYLRRAQKLDPADSEVQRRLVRVEGINHARQVAAHEALRAGDLARGFRMLREHALATSAPSSVPHWQGERVDRLLVIGSLGDGDTLHFVRYLPAAAARCGRLTVAVRRPLIPLLRANGYDAQDVALLPLQALAREADAQCDLLLLPSAVGGGYGPRGAYLRATAPRDYGPGFHVGVNWCASDTIGGRLRTIDPAMLAPLAGVPGATFHCLVFGERAKAAPAWMRPLALGDYADTANAFAGLDLVVSIDSGPAHLAGAIGVPLWVALPGPVADWRFETHAHKWRWYARSRLFRGPRCFESMAAMLGKLT